MTNAAAPDGCAMSAAKQMAAFDALPGGLKAVLRDLANNYCASWCRDMLRRGYDAAAIVALLLAADADDRRTWNGE